MMKRLPILLLLTFFLAVDSPAWATTYYVSNAGSDSNNGTSTSTPWATIGKVNAQTFNPGDSVLFNRGDRWLVQIDAILTPPSGTSSGVVTYGAYGNSTTRTVTGITYTYSAGTNFLNDSNLQGAWLLQNNTNDSSQNNISALSNNNGVTFTTSSPTPPNNYTYSANFVQSSHQSLSQTYANLPSSFPGKATPSGFTVSYWMYPTTITTEGFNVTECDGSNGWQTRSIVNSPNSIQALFDSGSWVSPTGNTWSANTWYHVAWVWNGTNVQLYVNGSAVGSPTSTSWGNSSSSGLFTIGKRSDYPSTYTWGGNMAEIAVFNRALSASEVASIYNHRIDGSLTSGIQYVYRATFNPKILSLSINGSTGTNKYGLNKLANNNDWTQIGNTLYIYSNSGTPSNVVATVDASYPVFDGTVGFTGTWTAESALWFTTATEANPRIFIINGNVCSPCANKTDLNSGTYKTWYDSTNGRWYVYTNSGNTVNPNNAEVECTSSGTLYCINTSNKSYLLINYLKVLYAHDQGIGCHGTQSNQEIAYNVVNYCGAGGTGGFDGICIYGSSGNQMTGLYIHNNILNHNLNNGIEVCYQTGAVVTRNIADSNGGAYELWGNLVNCSFTRNIGTNNLGASVATNSPNAGRGFWAPSASVYSGQTGCNSGNIIAYNIIVHGYNTCLAIDSGTGWQVYNNVFNDTFGPYGNTFVVTQSGVTDSVSLAFSNNFVGQYSTGTNIGLGVIFGQNASQVSLTGNNNFFWNYATGTAPGPLYNGTWDSFSQFVTASGQSADQNINPKFVNASGTYQQATDYYPLVNSPCINGGINASLTQDYVGNHVPAPGRYGAKPDIGAYEYQGGLGLK